MGGTGPLPGQGRGFEGRGDQSSRSPLPRPRPPALFSWLVGLRAHSAFSRPRAWWDGWVESGCHLAVNPREGLARRECLSPPCPSPPPLALPCLLSSHPQPHPRFILLSLLFGCTALWLRAGFLVVASGAALLGAGRASHCRNCSQAEHGLESAGSGAVAPRPSCSSARGIFPDQGRNSCPLHWREILNHWTTEEALLPAFSSPEERCSFFRIQRLFSAPARTHSVMKRGPCLFLISLDTSGLAPPVLDMLFTGPTTSQVHAEHWLVCLPLEEDGEALPTPMWMPDSSGLGMTLQPSCVTAKDF